MPKRVFYSECKCAACGETPDETTLYETGWRSTYWCGSDNCAEEIMHSNCDEVPKEDCISGWECDSCSCEYKTEQEAIDCCSEEEECCSEEEEIDDES